MTRAVLACGLALALLLAPRWQGHTGLASSGTLLPGPPVASAASPNPTPDGEGDPRSAGEGPGLVGAPLMAIGAVVGLGVLAVL